ncbi:MAG: hypothetical protein LBG15_07905 [Dysgonamonadaceae bacterium]|jgi:hypothetical protein|nr:hypothetical protein [Dysgonamonadaceae bacterium]
MEKTYTDEFLLNVSNFGILGYSVEKIIDLTDPPDVEQFRIDFSTPGTLVYKSYRKGKTTGEYSLDKDLFDKATKGHDSLSNTLLYERVNKKRIDNKISENFGT